MRHVCTVDGAGCRLPIVWDESASHYKFRHPRKVNEGWKSRTIDWDLEMPGSRVLTVYGSLDYVIALSRPVAKGDSEEWPQLIPAPTATPQEMAKLRIGA